MPTYNFDEIIPRKGTNCVKHDALMANFGSDDLLPMWVADNDFRSPDFVMQAIRERAQHEVLGYAVPSKGYHTAVLNWLKNHYRIEADKSQLHFVPGIVAGISFAIQALTREGDGILITTPVYPPFVHLPQGSHRQLVCSTLKEEGGRFVLDFDDLEQKAPACRLMILSNPHNPVGTVWSESDLRKIADLCQRHHLVLISDEIHADLTLPKAPLRHSSFSTVSEVAALCSITFIAPSKTFNIAGLGSSIAYVPNDELRAQFFGYLDTYEVALGNIFAYVGAEAAFAHGEDWLRQLLDYLQGNVDFMRQYLEEHLPRVKAMLPEASYLAWLDFSDYGMSHELLRSRLINEAKVALNDGTTFSPFPDDPQTQCRFRLNLGCPRATLKEALDRIAAMLSSAQ